MDAAVVEHVVADAGAFLKRAPLQVHIFVVYFECPHFVILVSKFPHAPETVILFDVAWMLVRHIGTSCYILYLKLRF